MQEFISLKENDPSKIYTLLHKISSANNQNDLYKVKNKKTGEIFAAKIIKKNLNLYREQLKYLKKFENPYLVQFYNSYIKKDKIWIITEYCDCGSVLDIIKIKNKGYNEAEIASIIIMVLKGLQYLHLQNNYHGGIKSSNILVNSEGVIKLSDFNISEQLLLNNENMDNNDIKKTPPELLRKNKIENYSVKSDIWYLGLTCIELAEGILDFKNSVIIPEKKNQNGMKNSNLWSLEFIDFIQKCLNENPLNRPSAASLLNHPFIIKNNKGKIIIKKKINSIRPLIDIYSEKIDEQEEKNNINELGKDNIEITSFNDNLDKDISNNINIKKNSVSLNINKSKYKKKSLLINREYKMNQYKKIKKFKICPKSLQIQYNNRNNHFIFVNKTNNMKESSKKRDKKILSIKKPVNSNEIFSIDENSLRKKRHLLINKYLKNSVNLHDNYNQVINKETKLNNTLENIYPKHNLMKILNNFDKNKNSKNILLNKSQRIKNIENMFNIFNDKSKNITNSIEITNIPNNINNNNNILFKNKEKKLNDKSLTSFDSSKYISPEKIKYSNYIDNNNNSNDNNLKLKTRNQKSNGGYPNLSDLNDNNINLKKITNKKNKILRNLLFEEKRQNIVNDNKIINNENKIRSQLNNKTDKKIYNNEYLFKLNNSENIHNKYLKRREKSDYKFPDISNNNNLNKKSKIKNTYYINLNEMKKIPKSPTSLKKNKINKKRIKQISNTKYTSNNINENSNIFTDSIQENEKSDYIFNINNTDININVNNINNNNNYYINNSKYNNKSYSFKNNIQNVSLLTEEDIINLCLNNKVNERELPELITQLAGLENKMYQEIQKIKEVYEPIISQHKEGIKFLKKNPFLKNIKEFKNYEIFKDKMKININDDSEYRTINSSVHNLNKIKISFYRSNNIEELNISANKYILDKTGYYNNNMKL